MTFFGIALLTAAGTLILAVFAVVTAWYARKAFLKQSQEVAAIERQVDDGRELARQQAQLLKVQADQLELQRREFEQQQAEHRRDQAARIILSTHVESSYAREEAIVVAVINNTSQQPIYEVHIEWRKGVAEDSRYISILMPGEHTFISPIDENVCLDVEEEALLFAAAVKFRDWNGVWWRTHPDGLLLEDINPE